MTIKTIINNIRLRINDEDRYRWSDEQVLTIVNEAVRFIRNVFLEENPILLTNGECYGGVLAKGMSRISMPYDVIKYVDVRINGKPIYQESINNIKDIEQTGTPTAFVPVGSSSAIVHPIPDEEVKWRVIAVRASTDLVEEDDLPFQSDYCDCVIEYVSMRMSMIDEYDQSVEAQLLGEIRSHIKAKLNDYAPKDNVVRAYY